MIDAYRGIAPDSQLTELATLAESLRGRSLHHVNATREGGGVAELLANLVPSTESLGVPTAWEILPASSAFFEITKAMHNALQGAEVEISHGELQRYREALREMAAQLRLDADVTIVHDPQPAYVIETPGVDRSRLVWRHARASRCGGFCVGRFRSTPSRSSTSHSSHSGWRSPSS